MLNKTVHLIGIIYVQTAVSTGRFINKGKPVMDTVRHPDW